MPSWLSDHPCVDFNFINVIMANLLTLVLISSMGGCMCDWALRWSDEFEGSALNTSLWTAAEHDCEAPPTWNQVECYMPGNVAVANGSL